MFKKYRAVYTHFEIICPDDSNIPPRLEYSRANVKSRLTHVFLAKEDSEAIKATENYANEFYKTRKKYVHKQLANKPSLEKLFEIIPPRRIKIS